MFGKSDRRFSDEVIVQGLESGRGAGEMGEAQGRNFKSGNECSQEVVSEEVTGQEPEQSVTGE